MTKIIYNKLVRDNIPEIIRADHKTCSTFVLDEQAFILKLKEKLMEESCEVKEADNKKDIIGELADVLEIVESIEKVYQINHEEVVLKKQTKKNKNGGFDRKLLLEYVEDSK
ncbi:MAG: nucleoside triphosphate pyrophosphohydrolase [Erysipelotrichaceae bacterium]